MLEYVMFWGQENYQSKSNKLVQLAKKNVDQKAIFMDLL